MRGDERRGGGRERKQTIVQGRIGQEKGGEDMRGKRVETNTREDKGKGGQLKEGDGVT